MPVLTAQLSGREAQDLLALLDHLASGKHRQGEPWRDAQVTRIEGGWSNLLYRVTGPLGDLAVKFTVRDKRDRAGREYDALLALHQAGLSIAPEPVLLDRKRYAQPVVVQTWLEGEASGRLPSTDAEWEKLLEHLATVHTVTPERTPVGLRRGVVDARSVREGRRIVRQQMARLPKNAQPASLRGLVRRFEATDFPGWSRAGVALCRVDNNILNVIRRPGAWASVDWENAGWGDPAFEMAQLMTHPAYIEVPCARWEWVVETYRGMMGDEAMARRTQVYTRMLAVWWVARVARYLYEVPRGLDQRLVDRPEGWETDMKAKYAHYLDLAEGLYT
jgi:aminoglycoside phosphotransferase (APT) family kinase protein